jgi:hypothetical protein
MIAVLAVTSGLGSSFDYMVWMGMGWFWSSLCGTVWSIEPLLDHTFRLIQHNWVVLAYNFNVVILMLIIGESCIGAFLLSLLLQFYPYCYLALSFYSCTCWVPTISVLNLAISPLLLKPTAQKERMDWNSSMRSSRLRVASVVVTMVLWSLPLFHSAENHHSLLRHYLCNNNYTLFVTFGYLWTLLAVCVEQLILVLV